jgi:hypothetical protein
MYGKDLYIEKRLASKIGEPDIFALFKGMPFHGESKNINELSLKNNEEFKEIQINNLKIKERAGAMCVGILLHKKITKFLPLDMLHDYITKEEFLNAEEFNFELLWKIWKNRMEQY